MHTANFTQIADFSTQLIISHTAESQTVILNAHSRISRRNPKKIFFIKHTVKDISHRNILFSPFILKTTSRVAKIFKY